MSTERAGEQETLARFWDGFADGARGPLAYLARSPGRTVRALRALRALPLLEVDPGEDADGRAIRAALTGRGPLGTPARWQGAAVLDLPADPEEHLAGPRRATLRRKVRRARKAGAWCGPVAPERRRELLAAADAAERHHPQGTYASEQPDNSDLLDHDLWLACWGPDGEALGLAVIPTDDGWGLVRYLRALGWDRRHSDCRYLLTHAVGVELARRGVRHLLDNQPPGQQTSGLRHFQRMVGYRFVRVRLRG